MRAKLIILLNRLKVFVRRRGLWPPVEGAIDVPFDHETAINVKNVTRQLDPFTGEPMVGYYTIHFDSLHRFDRSQNDVAAFVILNGELK